MEHLYEPKEEIPNNQNLAELLALVDMLGMQSLLELVCATMVTKLCHNFHKVIFTLFKIKFIVLIRRKYFKTKI